MTDPVSAERCAWCGGSGRRGAELRLRAGRITRGLAICPECNGTGTRPRPMPLAGWVLGLRAPCFNCGGPVDEQGDSLAAARPAALDVERLARALGVAAIEVGTPFPVFTEAERCALAIAAAYAEDRT